MKVNGATLKSMEMAQKPTLTVTSLSGISEKENMTALVSTSGRMAPHTKGTSGKARRVAKGAGLLRIRLQGFHLMISLREALCIPVTLKTILSQGLVL